MTEVALFEEPITYYILTALYYLRDLSAKEISFFLSSTHVKLQHWRKVYKENEMILKNLSGWHTNMAT